MRSGSRSKKVKVLVRIRPSQNYDSDAINVDKESSSLYLRLPRANENKGLSSNQKTEWAFKTDGIFEIDSQQDVYESVGADLISSGLAGVNGTIMCYGQTGAGKTFTITGATEMFNNRGLVPRALSHLFKEIESKSDTAVTVRVTYLEIYNDTMVDLLSTMPTSQEAASPLTIVEENGGTYVKGLNVHLAQSEEEALNLLFEGETNRATAAHALNKNSSRSHTIFTVYLETRSRFQSNSKYTISKINFVDLAGSERLEKTQSSGKTMQEASYINKSLSFLEQAVIAIGERNRDHIPYRQSKLTHYLRDSIGGNCKTILIANIWRDKSQIYETVSTMRFAQRMRCVASEPVENQRYDPQIMVRTLENEIAALRKELAMQNTLSNRSTVHYEPISEQQHYDLKQTVEKFLNEEIDQIDLVSVRQIEALFNIFREFYSSARQEAYTMAQQQLSAQTDSPGDGETQSQPPAASSVQLGAEGVGELDGNNFGISAKSGVEMEDSSAFLQNRRKEARRSRQQIENSASDSRYGIGATESPVRGNENASGSPLGEASQFNQQKPASPPSRTAAFEDFKHELGSEIYRILSENKVTLSDKKKEYSRLANQINGSKTEIDRSRLRLEALKVEREAQGNMFTDEGELIITEEEFVEIKKLRDLKESYKIDFEKLKELKTQIVYCQKMVDLTRQKLIQEFDKWFTESFLDGERSEKSSKMTLDQQHASIPAQKYDDPLEKFDQTKHNELQMTPGLEAYNRAQENKYFRHAFTMAVQQPQVSRKKPGAPVAQQQNQPPSRLEIF